MSRTRTGALALGLALALPTPAFAHSSIQGVGDFWAGALHLLTSLDQVILTLAVALWAGLQPMRPAAGMLGASFAACALGGSAALALDVDVSTAVPHAGLMVALGLAAAANLPAPAWLCLATAAAGGFLAGLDQGPAGSAAALPIAMALLGCGVALCSLLSNGLLAAFLPRTPPLMIARRAVASWIAAIGVMLLTLALFHGPKA
jgi:urease accessory protein